MSVLRTHVREGFIVTYFPSEIVTPPVHMPVSATDEALAAAVTEELERVVLWRAIVAQTRRITVDGPLPPRIELEPVAAITSITRWTPADDAEVVDAASYNLREHAILPGRSSCPWTGRTGPRLHEQSAHSL